MFKRLIAPAAALLVGLALSVFLLTGKPEPEPVANEPAVPSVRVLPAAAETLSLRVSSQGTVAPRTETELIAEVPGKLVRVGPGLEPGAYFEQGDVLAELDPRDLALAVKRARASREQARSELAFANTSLERRRALEARGIASPASFDEARRAADVAAARLATAEVELERASLDLRRTRIVAPFDGRTRARVADVGGFVSVGTPLARIYAVDYAEVRLPIPDSELAFLELPLGAEIPFADAPEVELRARFAGQQNLWLGRIVRSEAEIDPRTRMVTVVARVPRPYDVEPGTARAPLAAGLFVEAEIIGRRVAGVVRVPRSALGDDDRVWVVDAENRLRRQRVEVLRRERDTALVTSGLAPSARIALVEPRLAREGARITPVLIESIAGALSSDGNES